MEFWGIPSPKQTEERDSLSETDTKEDLSHLLVLLFLALKATPRPGLPHFANLKPYRVLDLSSVPAK